MNPRGQRTSALAIHVSHKDGANTRVVRYPLARTIPDVIVNDSPHAQIASRAALVREEPKVTDVLVANGQRARGRRQRGDGHNNKSGIHDGRSEKKKGRCTKTRRSGNSYALRKILPECCCASMFVHTGKGRCQPGDSYIGAAVMHTGRPTRRTEYEVVRHMSRHFFFFLLLSEVPVATGGGTCIVVALTLTMRMADMTRQIREPRAGVCYCWQLPRGRWARRRGRIAIGWTDKADAGGMH